MPGSDDPRLFGFNRIIWNIENYFAIFCKKRFVEQDLNMINCTDFEVNACDNDMCKISVWNLSFVPHGFAQGEHYIKFYLQRKEIERSQELLWVNYKVALLNERREEAVSIDGKGYFPVNSKKLIAEFQLQDTLLFKPFENDIINVSFGLIVKFDTFLQIADAPRSNELRHLSRDMAIMHGLKYNWDMTFKVGEDFIPAHKSIVSRCRRFAQILAEGNSDYTEIEIPIDRETFYTMLDYLYSGSIEIAAKFPTIKFYECAEYFNLDDILQYYRFHLFEFRTIYPTVEFTYNYFNYGFYYFNRADVVIEHTESQTTWKLKLWIDNQASKGEFLAFSAEMVIGKKPAVVSFDIGLVDRERVMFPLKALNYFHEKKECKIVCTNFVEKHNLFDILIKNNYLHIRVRVQMSFDVECSNYAYVSPPNRVRMLNSFDSLYSHFKKLLKESIFSDVTICCKGLEFAAHKCILSARSSFFRNLLTEQSDNKQIINITDYFGYIEPKVFSNVLMFIYTGDLIHFDINDFLLLYNVAEDLVIQALKESCILKFEEQLSVENATEIMTFAEEKGNGYLKYCSLKFICKNFKEIQKQKNWTQFTETQPNLMSEIEKIVKSKDSQQHEATNRQEQNQNDVKDMNQESNGTDKII